MERINTNNNIENSNTSNTNHQDNYFIHLARYVFCSRLIDKNEEVLEMGCGTGYGASLLSDFCKNVTAHDVWHHELENEWEKYNKPNLTFVKDLPNKKFDNIVSLEVLEHVPIPEVEDYFNTIKNSLSKNGTLYLSTPRYLPKEQRSQNRLNYHEKEYTQEELKTLLKKHFNNVYFFSQNDALISTHNPKMAWTFMTICTNKK